MKKKLIATLLALSVLATCLVGCGNGDKETTEAPDKTTAGAQAGEGTTAGETPEATTEAEDVTIKVLLCLPDNYQLAEIDTIAALQRLDEAVGVKTEWEIVRKAAWDTHITTMMATGKYPDLIISRNGAVDREEYGVDQGILIPLDDLIAEYMPNYTDRIDECGYDPTVSLRSSDGKTYTIGYMSAEDISTWSQWYINQKWLDNLKLETPTTIDQLTDVLRKFKTEDPNGNNEADEIPLSLVMDTSGIANSGIGYMLPLFGIPFGGANSWLFVDDNAKVQFIPTQEGFRECMEWLNLCYTEGLLDVEALSQDADALNRKLEDNVIGFVTAWRVANGTTYAETAGKDLALFNPVEGSKIYHYLELASARVYMTKTNAHPEKTAQWLNEYLETENMYDLMKGKQDPNNTGAWQGWYFNADGKITSIPKPEGWTVNDFLAGNGLYFAPGPYKSRTEVISANGIEKTEANDVYEAIDGLYQKYSNDYLKTVSLSADDAAKKTLKDADFATAINEWLAKFIMNGVTDSSWNEFVGVMNSIGCDEYVEMHQKALDTLELK